MRIDIVISEKTFNPDMLYSHIVHYYIDKKGCTKEEANEIAQTTSIILQRLHKFERVMTEQKKSLEFCFDAFGQIVFLSVELL